MYADDLIIISMCTSISDLTSLITLSCSILKSLDLHINFSKSCCISVGKRFSKPCPPILIDGNPISWSATAKYLGVYFISHSSFKCNWHEVRKHFFSSLNHILYSLGSRPNIAVSLALFQKICLSIIIVLWHLCHHFVRFRSSLFFLRIQQYIS